MSTITGTLTHGFKFKEKLQKTFEMSEVETAGALFDAEIESGGLENQLAFNGALIARQLVRIGDCDGPFTLSQIRALTPGDFQVLREAQGKLDRAASSGSMRESEAGTA
ncbi:hypothetical protein [Neptunomonas antarctica]|uniref:Mu-like prophage FluMu protein gp41 n=1 Tax=Neptunomonas antarctica TaxID=619304 RepID=A0A1N7MNX4_9GAMM|nr:hypothetical protein [Neptunomonas antarctica]SIS87844.1 Mu-like prophage FluMu protein gp41 [Neptunomonas antarctica]